MAASSARDKYSGVPRIAVDDDLVRVEYGVEVEEPLIHVFFVGSHVTFLLVDDLYRNTGFVVIIIVFGVRFQAAVIFNILDES